MPAAPTRAIRSTQTAPNQSLVRDLTAFGTGPADTTTAGRFGVGITTVRFEPNQVAATERTIPASGSAQANQGWRDVAATDAANPAVYDTGTWTLRLKLRKSGEALASNRTIRLTAILYVVTADATPTFISEVGRAVSADSTLSTADLVLSLSFTTAVATQVPANARLMTEVYIQNIAAGQPSVSADEYIARLVLNESSANNGPGYTAQPSYGVLRTISASGAVVTTGSAALRLTHQLSASGAAVTTGEAAASIPGSGYTYENSFEGGADGTTLTTANSGGTSGRALDFVSKSTEALMEFDSAQARGGVLSALHDTTVGAATTAWYHYETPSQGLLYGRAYARFNLAPSQRIVNVYATANRTGGTVGVGILTNKFVLRDSAGAAAATSVMNVPLDQWIRLEWFFNAAGDAKLRIFTDPASTTPAEELSVTAMPTIATYAGCRFGLAAAASRVWTDDYALSNVGWIGPASTPTLQITASGAAVTSGTAAMTLAQALSASGAVTTTGQAAVTSLLRVAASGAATTTGSAAVTSTLAFAASGAAVTTGQATITALLSLAASGAATSTGSAAMTVTGAVVTHQITASGAAITTGAAATTLTLVLTASGAAATTGAASLVLVLDLRASGAATTTGSAAITSTLVVTASGAAVTSGSGAMALSTFVTASGTTTTAGTAAATLTAPALLMSASGLVLTTGSAAMTKFRGPPALSAVGAAVTSSGSVTTPLTLNPTMPAHVTGQLLLCYTACRSSTPTVATPSGWSQILNTAATNGRLAVFAKVATSNAEASPSVTWSNLVTGTSGSPIGAQVAAFDNASTAIDVTGAVANGAASTTTSAGGAAATTVAQNTLLLSLTTRLDDVGTFSAPTNLAMVGSGATASGADFAFAWAWRLASPGSQPVANFTLAGASSFASSGIQLALVPAVNPADQDVSASGAAVTSGAANVTLSGVAVTHQVTASGAATSVGAAALTILHTFTASGAAVSSGTAGLRLVQAFSASGAATSSGSASITALLAFSASGAAITAGSASFALLARMSASGTATTTGTAAMSLLVPLSASGAATTTGSAAAVLVAAGVVTFSASGAAVTSGTASLTMLVRLSASGAAVTTGTAALTLRLTMSASGLVTTTGSAAAIRVMSFSASGAAVTTGSASASIVSGLTASGLASTSGAASLTLLLLASASGAATTSGAAALTLAQGVSASGASMTTGSASLTLVLSFSASGLVVTSGSASAIIPSALTKATATGVVRSVTSTGVSVVAVASTGAAVGRLVAAAGDAGRPTVAEGGVGHSVATSASIG